MALLGARAPSLAPGVELLGALDGSGYVDAQGLVRRGDGQTLQVTGLLFQLLGLLDGHRDREALAVALGERIGRTVTAGDVDQLLESKIAPMGVLATAEGVAPAVEKSSPLLGLKLKVVVSDPAATRRITGPFAWLFRTWVVVPVLLAFAAVCAWVLLEQGLASATRQAFDSPGLLLAVFAITVASAGWHEFGHAAACRARGATPGAMGAGLYLVWPAFYTDVDDSYRLSRWGRLVVDLGGLYFNALLAVAVVGAWWATGVEALLLVVATQLLLMLRQLAPVVRADGYHILADLTGVPDLFRHLGPTLSGLLPKNWGRPQPLRRRARWIVSAWVLIVVPLLLWMLLVAVLLLPRLVASAWDGLRQQGSELAGAAQDADVLGVLAGILQSGALLLPVAAVSYLLVRLVHRTGRAALTRTQGRPLGRAGVLLVAALLLGMLAWAWWPSGQYTPVRADERGTLLSATRAAAVQGTAFRPIEGVEPRSAYALLPRNGDGPTLLLVRSDDGSLRSVLADGDRSGVAFPFELPDAPGGGDNQALAVNTEDGTVVYDVAVALVWIQDGSPADNRNEAYALASCTECTTVAVAFQVVLVIGQSDAVAPVNVAVAANGDCLQCSSTALARQLFVTLREAPSTELRAQIEAAMARLDGLPGSADPYAEVQAVEREVLALLGAAGLVEGQEATSATDEATASSTPTASPQPSGSARSSPEASPFATPGPVLSRSPAASATPAPVPSPTDAPAPTPTGSSATPSPSSAT